MSDKQRIGILTVSTGLLEQWLHLPAGTRVVGVCGVDDGVNGYFEVLLEGAAIPESAALEATPYLDCVVTTRRQEVSEDAIEAAARAMSRSPAWPVVFAAGSARVLAAAALAEAPASTVVDKVEITRRDRR